MSPFHFWASVSSATLLFVLLTALTVVVLPSSDAVEFGDFIVNDEDTAKKWVRASAEFDSLLFPHKTLLIQTLDDISVNRTLLKLSDDCASSLQSISNGLKKNQMWAYQFMDSAGRGKSGMTYGFISDLGQFDQCLGIKVKKEETTNAKEFQGKYCMVNLKFPLTQEPDRNFLRASHFSDL